MKHFFLILLSLLLSAMLAQPCQCDASTSMNALERSALNSTQKKKEPTLPHAEDCAMLAYELAADAETIPYLFGGTTLAGLDCRGYVMYIIRALGGTIRVAGATELWNSNLQYKDTIENAINAGKLVPGALLFHIEGKTAEHVGWYTDIPGQEVAHATSRKRKVILSESSDYFGHVGWSDVVDYSTPSIVPQLPAGENRVVRLNPETGKILEEL